MEPSQNIGLSSASALAALAAPSNGILALKDQLFAPPREVDLASIPASGIREISNASDYSKIPTAQRAYSYATEQLSTSHPIQENNAGFTELTSYIARAGIRISVDPAAANDYPVLLMREPVANLLRKAAILVNKASDGEISLQLGDPYRPRDLQEKYFREYWPEATRTILKEDHADLCQRGHFEQLWNCLPSEIDHHLAGPAGVGLKREESALIKDLFIQVWNEATMYVAHPRLAPPHTTGGAVDVCLVYTKSGERVDLGAPFQDGTPDKREHTWNPAVAKETPEAFRHRCLLYNAMTQAGFTNLATEFWHYSHGDSYAAVVTGEPAAQYGPRSIQEVLATLDPRCRAEVAEKLKVWSAELS